MTPSGSSSGKSHSGLSAGAKAGIAIGVIVGVAAIVVLAAMFFLRRRRQSAVTKGTSLQNLGGMRSKDEELGSAPQLGGQSDGWKRPNEPEVSSVHETKVNPFSD